MKKLILPLFLGAASAHIYCADHPELETETSATATVPSATPDRRLHELLASIASLNIDKVTLLASSPDIINTARPFWTGATDTYADTPLGLATRLAKHAEDDVNNAWYSPKGKEAIKEIVTILKNNGATNNASQIMSLDEIKEYSKTNTIVFFSDEENQQWYSR